MPSPVPPWEFRQSKQSAPATSKAPVDPKEHKLVEVLAQYSFAKLVPCGLSSCKQGHLHGFLVRTATGAETNIGHVCGKREFGQDFVMASAKFRRDEERRVTLGRVLTLQGECNRVEALMHGLITRSFGVRWLFSVRDAVRARIGGPAYEHLKLRSIRQEYKVTRVRELTATEIKRAVDRTGLKREQVRYSTERLGELRPMAWMSWNFKDELLTGVRDEFRLLTTLAPSQAETKELKRRLAPRCKWRTWCHCWTRSPAPTALKAFAARRHGFDAGKLKVFQGNAPGSLRWHDCARRSGRKLGGGSVAAGPPLAHETDE